jgi:hypothetical protein
LEIPTLNDPFSDMSPTSPIIVSTPEVMIDPLNTPTSPADVQSPSSPTTTQEVMMDPVNTSHNSPTAENISPELSPTYDVPSITIASPTVSDAPQGGNSPTSNTTPQGAPVN